MVKFHDITITARVTESILIKVTDNLNVFQDSKTPIYLVHLTRNAYYEDVCKDNITFTAFL